MKGEFMSQMSQILQLLPLFYPILCVDPDPYSEYGSTKLLNTNNTDPDPQHW